MSTETDVSMTRAWARTARDVSVGRIDPRHRSPSTLRSYAFIADGQRGALVSPDGDIAWMCFPGFSDQAVFAGLLGSGGTYRLSPAGRCVPGGHYEDGTLIWRSRWTTERGIVESRDAMAYPGDPHRAVILRQIVAIDDPAEVIVELAPAVDYGRRALGAWQRDGDAWVIRNPGGIAARWSGAPEADVVRGTSGTAVGFRLALKAGERRDLVLELSDRPLCDPSPVRAEQLWHRTAREWASTVPSCDGMVARADVRRGFAVLYGMTAADGGTVAAATTSLPERAEGNRNYDYRYCWVRDICYVGRAGAAVPGGESLLDASVAWVTARLLSDGSDTRPAYLADGRLVPEQRSLNLPGYPGGHDVIGNRAGDQFQLDLFGESLLLLALAAQRGRLDRDGWRAAHVAFDVITEAWKRPEAGIWETQPDRWTHSRLICVAGLRAAARSNAPNGFAAEALTLADRIMRWTKRSCRHPSGRWQRSPTDERVDAALLLAEIRGAVAPDDPLSIATRDKIVTDLEQDGYLYRYAHPGRPLFEAEGSFLICNFWMALARFQSGDHVDGVRWFERGRSGAGTTGLFAEEFDVVQHQQRGNLPQAFVHALLIEAAAAQGKR